MDELAARRLRKCSMNPKGHKWVVGFKIKTCMFCGTTVEKVKAK